ncbi:MAG: NADH-quinone oxidoreductase subunit NuoE [Anaplasma sp.]
MSQKTEEFKFTDSNLEEARRCIAYYPEDRKSSAVMPLLHIVQDQAGGFIPSSAIGYVADLLGMRQVHVREVVEFYSMFNTSPVGKYLVQVCRTTPCWLRGGGNVLNACKKALKINVGESTKDSLFTLREVECLGACTHAPVVQINNDYFEDLDSEKIVEILQKLKKNEG